MLHKIFGTIGTRIICVGISFALLIINSHVFGPEGVGTIGLFVLGVSILQILTSLLGSSSLVYMLPRHNAFQILFVAHISSLIINIAGSAIMLYFHLVPVEYASWFIVATICVSIYATNTATLLSKEKIAWFNIAALLQMVLLIMFTLYLIYGSHCTNVISYIAAYTISYFIVALLTFLPSIKGITYTGWTGIKQIISQLIKYGIIIQITNLVQMLNYRFSYYIIEFCAGRSPLGIFDNSTKVSESIWIIPKSLSSLEYAAVSNHHQDTAYIHNITLSFVKLSLLGSLITLAVVICLPVSVFTFLLGEGFADIKPVICLLAPGIFIFSGNIIISHYFSGLGKFTVNTIASAIGLAITVVCGLACIPLFHSAPAMHTLMIMALITSISYVCSFGYTLIKFCRETQVHIKQFIITRNDILMVKQALLQRLHHES